MRYTKHFPIARSFNPIRYLILLLALSAVSLAGCGQKTQTVVKTETKIVKQKVPEVWLGGCLQYLPTEKPGVRTGGELASVPSILVEALEQCNQDITEIRKWSREDEYP